MVPARTSRSSRLAIRATPSALAALRFTAPARAGNRADSPMMSRCTAIACAESAARRGKTCGRAASCPGSAAVGSVEFARIGLVRVLLRRSVPVLALRRRVLILLLRLRLRCVLILLLRRVLILLLRRVLILLLRRV